MKNIKTVSAVILFAFSVGFTACRSSGNYRTAAAKNPVYIPLIITPYPGFTMSMHPSGRYLHRSRNGFLYWKNFDNRFYLDSRYLNKINYSAAEYAEWKRYKKRRGYRR